MGCGKYLPITLLIFLLLSALKMVLFGMVLFGTRSCGQEVAGTMHCSENHDKIHIMYGLFVGCDGGMEQGFSELVKHTVRHIYKKNPEN